MIPTSVLYPSFTEIRLCTLTQRLQGSNLVEKRGKAAALCPSTAGIQQCKTTNGVVSCAVQCPANLDGATLDVVTGVVFNRDEKRLYCTYQALSLLCSYRLVSQRF